MSRDVCAEPGDGILSPPGWPVEYSLRTEVAAEAFYTVDSLTRLADLYIALGRPEEGE